MVPPTTAAAPPQHVPYHCHKPKALDGGHPHLRPEGQPPPLHQEEGGASLPGPSCTESPSPTPPGPRPPACGASHEGERRSGSPRRPSPDQSWPPRVSSDPSDLEEGVSSSHSGPGRNLLAKQGFGFYVVNGCQGYFLSIQGLSTVNQSNLRLRLCPFQAFVCTPGWTPKSLPAGWTVGSCPRKLRILWLPPLSRAKERLCGVGERSG